ncbi:MAG: Trp family transcriptional regulator [bacterium]|nr:Trp family transcriptional regulator [bacterium]
MPHVSKKKLEEKYVRDLFWEIISVFERAGRRGELKQVLAQLLTSTEKVMLAKRLAVINMLVQNIPIHDIAESLSMSPSTIDIMSLKFETENYSYIVESGLNKMDIGDVIRMIQTVGGVMPPRSGGKGRWKFLDDTLRKERIASRIKKLKEKKKNYRSKN